MMNRNRILYAVICVLLIIPVFCMQAFAVEVRIEDSYGLLDSDDIDTLTKMAQDTAQTYSINIFVVIDDYYDGSDDGSDFAMEYYHDKFADEMTDSVILTVDNFGGEGNRHVYILSSGRCSEKIDVNEIEDITLDLQYLIMDDNVYGCVKTFIDEVGAKMSLEPITGERSYDDYGDGDDYSDYSISRSFSVSVGSIVGCIVFALCVGAAAVIIVKNKYKKFGISSAVDANAMSTVNIKVSTDDMINKVVTTRVLPKDPPPDSNSHSDNFSGFSGGNDSGGSGGGFSGGGRGF